MEYTPRRIVVPKRVSRHPDSDCFYARSPAVQTSLRRVSVTVGTNDDGLRSTEATRAS